MIKNFTSLILSVVVFLSTPLDILAAENPLTGKGSIDSIDFSKSNDSPSKELPNENDFFSKESKSNDGLVSYWTFNGSDVNDAAGGNHGVMVGSGISFAQGMVGNAIEFSQGSSYVEIPSINLQYISVEAWVKSSKYGYYTSMVTKNYFLSQWTEPYVVWQLWFLEDTSVPGTFGLNYTWNIGNTNPIPMNEWYHMAFTYDGYIVRYYLNGSEVANAVIDYGPLPATDGNVYIGKPATSNHTYTGLIDEVAIWDRALTATEILQHYQNGLNGLGYTAQTTPTVLTHNPTHITDNSAILTGEVVLDGGSSLWEKGFYYGTQPNPESTGTAIYHNSEMGYFESTVSLSPNTTYYFKTFAVNSQGTSYGSEISFTTYNSIVTDIDGNVYGVITIGSQKWMKENLRTTRYQDGSSIPNITADATWTSLTTDAYCWFNNQQSNGDVYGGIYNFYAVMDGRNICPSGWHVPSDAEWTTLSDFLGGVNVAGGKLKEVGLSHWIDPNTGATDDFGFSALPGGYRYGNDGLFKNLNSYGYWWTSTQYDTYYSINRYVDYSSATLSNEYRNRMNGFSVRCIKDVTVATPTITTNAVLSITQTSASVGCNITNDGGAPLTERGVVWNTTGNPTVGTDSAQSDGVTEVGGFTIGIAGLAPSTTYYVRAYAINSQGTSYGNEIQFKTYKSTVNDIDGNTYYTVVIGNQEWMACNLKTTLYANGESISNVTDNNTWAGLTTGAYCWYDNDFSNYGSIYGALYNWYAVVDSRSICPTGWHVPSNEEWTELSDYLGGMEVTGSKLMEMGIAHWPSPNQSATNETSFTALPGGQREYGGALFGYGLFAGIGNYAYWWTSTEWSSSMALNRYIDYNGYFNDYSPTKVNGQSVRCVKDQSSNEPMLIAHYPFNGTANDESGNEFHGTVYGGATLTPDRYYADNSAWSFNGSDSYISIPGILPAGSNPLFTISQWIYIEDYTWGAFFGSGQTAENDKHISLCVSISGTYRELGVDHWGSLWNTGYIMPLGWNMVTYVSDGSQDVLYVNGQQVGTRAYYFTLDEGAETSIGRWNDQNGNYRYFNSKIDDVSVYSSALSAQEVESLYQQENPYAGGTGTEADPWLIATPEQLNLVRYSPEAGRYFRQINDIELNQWPWNEDEGWEPIGNASYPFKGNYNGNGFKVVGLTSQRSGTNFIGLFGYVTDATITNLGVASCNVTGYQYVGGLAGFIYQSNVINCYTSGTVTSAENHTGGLVGMSSNFAEIQSSYSTAEVFGYLYTGGLVGYNNYSIINNCYATGAVHGSYSGGLVGYTSEGNIANSYSIGSTETTYGGLICLRNGGSVLYSYWDFLASGVVNSNGGGVGLITGDMAQEATFENWDFNSMWAISEGTTYPYLQWQGSPGAHNIANVTQGFEGGAGTESNPWQIATPTQLDNIRNFKDGGYYFNLITDIDLNQSPWNEGEGWMPIGIDGSPFVGHFNGNGHSINGLYINRPENGYQGLFGNIDQSTISGLRIENCNITAHDFVGAVAGNAGNSSISTCSSSGYVVGYNYSGGIAGLTGSGLEMENSYSTASVVGNYYVGGLSGFISGSYIANCYATGDISGYEFVGGLVGHGEGGNVINCYSTGQISASGYQHYTGGLIGHGSSSVQSSYWDIQTSGKTSSYGGEGKSTPYMVEQGLYSGWDFNETWAIQEYQTYPYLLWQSQPGDHNFVSDIQGPFAGGAGTPTNPWQISTREQLDSLRRYLGPAHSDKYFMIINDIDLYNYPATGPGWLPIGTDANPFQGQLLAEGHAVSNLKINRNTMYNVGLFGYIFQGEVRNLVLTDVNINGDYNVGAVTGYLIEGIIDNCHVYGGQVTGNTASYGDYIGAIVGYSINNSNIAYTFSNVNVSGRGFVGGLVGSIQSITSLSESEFSGTVTGGNYYYVGGVVGYSYYSSVSECSSVGSVTSQGNYVGGLVGFNQVSSITSSYSSGAVTGSADVGGLVGRSEGSSTESSQIINCSASGDVQGSSRIGGLIGYNYQTSSLSDCSASGNVTGYSSVGGLIGEQGSPNYTQTISNCSSLGSVTATGNYYAGGFIGYCNGGTITNSYSRSMVIAPNTNYVGGFVGYANAGSISSCFATGHVEGNIFVGGFMGNRSIAIISNSYSTGNVKGNQYAGGFMGSVDSGQTQSVVNCYSVGHVSCDNDYGGFAGWANSGELVYCFYNSETSGKTDNDHRGAPLNTAQMLQSGTFTYWEWNFSSIWTNVEGSTYPFLQWQNSPWEFNYPPETPSVYTLSISEITSNSAIMSGNVADDGGAYILSRGVVWSTSEYPTLDNHLGVSYCGEGMGDFSCDINDLSSSTLYYARAFAINVAGTAYGDQQSFSTASSWTNRDFMFAAGYTWFSFNLSDEAILPNTVFSGYSFINNDRIIGQTQYSIFYDGTWVGSLPSISGYQMYKLKLDQPLNFNLGGEPTTIVPIELNSGYTWLGYLPQECLTINDALANSSFQNQLTGDERIIGQNGFAVYDYSQGLWTGDLTQLCPGEGYIIKLKSSNTLTYPNYGKGAPEQTSVLDFASSGITLSANKQHTMMLIATLQVSDKENVIDKGDMLFAFAGDECRGVAAVNDGKLIFMSIGSNGNLPAEQINFRLWSSKTSTFFDVEEVFTFQPLKELGSLANPTLLKVGKGVTDNSTILSETVTVGEPQPNPFTHFTTIPLVLVEPSMVKVRVYSPAGLLLKQNSIQSFDAGLHSVEISRGDLKPGIYLYTVVITYGSERIVKNGRFVVN